MPELPKTPDRSALPPVAFVSTLHDPTGRLLGAVRERGAALADYDAVYVTVTDATHRGLAEELMARAVHVIGGKNDQVGTARRRALQGAFDDGHGAALYCDFDRWLHWVGCAPAELAGLPQRLLGRRRPLWYACLGRSKRAFATHPYVQRVAEGATNRAISLALGRRLDATAGACWVSGEGAAIILAHSQEATNATDLE
ncbi:MAG: hypothetical protein M3442_00125, partial [Chloroflexota bacterium]|nr:hypothetical protein [Chloroflexota bacterium]